MHDQPTGGEGKAFPEELANRQTSSLPESASA